MSLPVNVFDGFFGTGGVAGVTSIGQLVVAPFDYDDVVFNTLDVIDTAYHFFPPIPRKQFIIRYVIVFADKDVADNTDTVIEIYEADSTTSTTVDKTLLKFGMGKLTVLPLPGLNGKVNIGKFVNAKTGDDDIHMTIMGHYIPQVD